MVAFPTETVYGLGANALDEQAVERIFAAKGRPATSPLIVHCANTEIARNLAKVWSAEAERLAAHFWPGPLTLVVPKRDIIPGRVTAGLPTVGLRVPRHPVALALMEAAGVPIAAPSANRFMGLSPTQSAHVLPSLADLILEGGPSDVGIESTVVSLVGAPTLLRPGMIPLAELEQVLGCALASTDGLIQAGAHASPGLHAQHYSPATPLTLGKTPDTGRGVWLRISQDRPASQQVQMPTEPALYAQRLYEELHRLDHQGWDWIAVETPPASAAWDGIRDRLERAQHT